jgi:hypothetical protein
VLRTRGDQAGRRAFSYRTDRPIPIVRGGHIVSGVEQKRALRDEPPAAQNLATNRDEVASLEDRPDTRPPHATIVGFVLAIFVSLGIWFGICAIYLIVQ